MRVVRLVAVAVALALVTTPALAGSGEEVIVFYGIPPFAPPPPPVGYAYHPSDQRAPVYIADQGPAIEGPGVYAYHGFGVPTSLEGGYAVVTRDVYPTPFPYVRRVPRRLGRPYALAPYGAYPYRRVIHVR
jgi:hypothetical protein